MIRLGLNLALSGGRGAVARIGLTALAVAVGTAVLLFALSFKPALDDRSARAAWWDATQVAGAGGIGADDTGLRMSIVEDRVLAEPLLRILVAPIDATAPVPPGVARLPAFGEAFVSPALADRMAALPADQLGDRIGRIAGIIGSDALRSPDELIAVIGLDDPALRDLGSFTVQRFPTEPRVPDLPPVLVLIVVLAVAGALAPVIVFVSTATRLSAARREQRLAALRLVGGTPAQVARLAAIEAVVPTILGAIGGLLLFLLTRPLVARIPLDEATWHVASIAPPPLVAAGLLLAVPLVGVAAAVLTLGRIVITPLGVQRRQTPPPPGPLRLVPLAISVVALLGILGLERSRVTSDNTVLALVGVAFAGIVGGIALAGPWLTALVGHALRQGPGGASTLLAARRLTDDPRGSFGAIAGVIMAVFVASAFFTFTSYSRTQAGAVASPLRAGQVVVDLPYGLGSPGHDVADRLTLVPGVRTVLPLVAGELHHDHGIATVWVVHCASIVEVLAEHRTTCGDRPVHTSLFDMESGEYQFIPDRPGPDGTRRAMALSIDAGQVDQRDAPSFWLPPVLLEPDVVPGLAAVAGISSIHVATDGDPATTERIRTAVFGEFPTASVSRAGDGSAAQPMFQEFERVVHLGLIGTMILAGCSLAVAVTTGMLDRRRQFALLRSAGMPVSRLAALVMLQAAAPLVTVAAFSAILGIVVAQAVLGIATSDIVPLPDASLLATLAGSVLGALAVVALTLPPLERMTRPDAIRLE